jgi:uncharacterized protein (TIGR03905 family)
MKKLAYTPVGVCSEKINFTIDAGRVVRVEFLGGCDGNLQGISNLIEGMEVAEAIKRLRGIDCGGRGTSCPDQLARALEEASKKQP